MLTPAQESWKGRKSEDIEEKYTLKDTGVRKQGGLGVNTTIIIGTGVLVTICLKI